MKLRKQHKVIGFCFLFYILFCFANKNKVALVSEIDKNKIEDFDLIISKGQSAQSKFIGLLDLTFDDYSHVGIMRKENDKIFVLHSTSDGTNANGIRYDDLQTFFDLSDVSDYKVLKHQNLTSDLRRRLGMEFDRFKNSQVPFDFNFNNFDQKKIYCSELVCIIFKNSGLSSLQKFDMTKPIYPKYFLKVKELVTINTKKNR